MIPREVETIDSVLSDHAGSKSTAQFPAGAILLPARMWTNHSCNKCDYQAYPCNQCGYQSTFSLQSM